MIEAKPKIQIVEDPAELASVAASKFKQLANETVEKKGIFNVALSGGSTPKAMFDLLSEEPYKDSIPWLQVHLFWGDERHVPPDNKDSNYRMTREHLLSKIDIPPKNVHRVEAENSDAKQVATNYQKHLQQYFNLSKRETPQFDLVFLGMGDDGHTASLFPGTDAVHDFENLVAAPWVEKFNSHRITITPKVINNSDRVIFLVKGEEKADALVRVIEGEKDIDRYPAQVVDPTHGSVLWLCDRASSSKLSSVVKV